MTSSPRPALRLNTPVGTQTLLRFPVHVVTTVDDDGDAAVERFRAQLEAWPVLRAESGLPDGPVSTEAAAGRSASGTPAHVRQRLRAYLEAGATEVIVVSGDPVTALGAILDIPLKLNRPGGLEP